MARWICSQCSIVEITSSFVRTVTHIHQYPAGEWVLAPADEPSPKKAPRKKNKKRLAARKGGT